VNSTYIRMQGAMIKKNCIVSLSMKNVTEDTQNYENSECHGVETASTRVL